MLKAKRTRLVIFFTSVVFAISLLLGLFSFQDKAKLTASADTETDIAETIGLSNLGYAESSDVITLQLTANGGHIKTSGFQQFWNDNGATNAAANNNVDLMEYVLIDGVSMRDLVNANAAGTTSYTGTLFPFDLGGVYSPVQFITVEDSHIALRVLTTFKNSFTMTFTTGFAVMTADGEKLVLSEEVSFAVTESTATKVIPETDVTETLSLDHVGYVNGVRVFYMRNNGAEIGCGFEQPYWNDNGVSGTHNAASNFGVDLMAYILVDGVSMRDLVNANAAGTTSYTGAEFPWSLGGVYSPVQVCTESEVALIRVLNEFKTEYTLTIKAGFTLLTKDNVKIYTTKDIKYAVTADSNSISKIEEYTLSFGQEGENAIMVIGGQAIGELPAVPAKDGCEGVWTIDGAEITADTVYSYGTDKTAVALYKKDVTETLSIDHVGFENDARVFYMRNNGAEIGCGFEQPYWNDNGVSGTNNAASNFGVDLMACILVDGVSMRDLVNANAAGTTSYTGAEFPWSLGGVYSPVQVCTESEVALIRVLNEFKTEYTLTIKAGFTLVTKDGTVFYTTEDMYYKITSEACVKAYAVTFNGENTVYVSENGFVEYPAELSETKESDEQYSYVYNWFLNGALYDFSSPVTADMNLTSDGTFTGILRKYTVSFDGANATEYEYGSTIEKPVDPIKTSTAEYEYIFDAWYNGETKWDFENDRLTGNTDLVAKFNEKKKTYSVTFDGANATEYEYGSKIEKPADPTKESTAEYDYIFDAWYNGETEWDFENDTLIENVDLVAKYTETKRLYTITFNVTGYDLQLDPVQVEYGTNYDFSNLLEGVDLTGYVYSVSVAGVERLNVEVFADVTVDVVVTKQAEVSDDKDDGTGCMSAISGGIAVVSVMAIAVALFKKKEQ